MTDLTVVPPTAVELMKGFDDICKRARENGTPVPNVHTHFAGYYEEGAAVLGPVAPLHYNTKKRPPGLTSLLAGRTAKPGRVIKTKG
jgi:diadenosine tetraphosphate (Ap4A) HIT family hydrolase